MYAFVTVIIFLLSDQKRGIYMAGTANTAIILEKLTTFLPLARDDARTGIPEGRSLAFLRSRRAIVRRLIMPSLLAHE